MTNIEQCVPVRTFHVVAVDRQDEVPAIGGNTQRMGPRVAGHIGKAMPVALRQHRLQAAVVGVIALGEIVNVFQIRERRVVGAGRLFRATIWRAVPGGRRRNAGGENRGRPARSECGLIEIGDTEQLRTMVTDVGNIQREAIAEGALDVHQPAGDVRSSEVLIDPEDAALRGCNAGRVDFSVAVAAGGRGGE